MLYFIEIEGVMELQGWVPGRTNLSEPTNLTFERQGIVGTTGDGLQSGATSGLSTEGIISTVIGSRIG